MSDRRRNYILANFNQRDTDELVAIWAKHDKNEWTDLALDIVREILQNRQIELSPKEESWVKSGRKQLAKQGVTYRAADEPGLEECCRALAVAREVGDRREEGRQLLNVGVAFSRLTLFWTAIQHYEQALAVYREIGDHSQETEVLEHLGQAFQFLQESDRALKYYEQALLTCQQAGGPAARLLIEMGRLCSNAGRADRAIEYLRQARDVSRTAGDRSFEVAALSGLAHVYAFSRQMERALECHEQALAICRETGDRKQEAGAWVNIGSCHFFQGQGQRAVACYEQGLAISREIGDRRTEAMCLKGLGATFATLGQTDKARRARQAATRVSGEI